MFSIRLKEAREKAQMSQQELARKLFMSQGAVAKYETDKSTPTPETIVKLAEILNVSVGWLLEADDDITREEYQRIKKYRALDEYGKRAVDAVLDIEGERHKVIEFTKTVPLIGNSFAAGTGEPDFGQIWTSYETTNTRADFAVRINGDSMQPYLPDGSIQLGASRTPRDGEVGALLIDGEFLVKQVATDSFGNLYLFSLNRDRKDADRTLWAKDDHNVMCFGTVLMQRVPLPTVN